MQFIHHLDGNVIVCDTEGIIIYRNETAIRNYAKDGGAALIGKNLMDCHGPQSQEKIREIIRTCCNNVYTIEKNGRKKLIYQSPWIEGDELKGIIELSLVIPFDMPHYNRDKS